MLASGSAVLVDKHTQRPKITPDIYTQKCIHLLNKTAWGCVKIHSLRDCQAEVSCFCSVLQHCP